MVVDVSTGTIEQSAQYDTWGKVVQSTGEGFQPFGFAGGLYDPATKLVRFGARDYDPEVGRWLAKDPTGFAGEDTNLYAYVDSDPVNQIDPSGTVAVPVVVAGVAVFAEIMLATDDSQVAWAIGTAGFGVLAGRLVTPLFKWAVNGRRIATRAAQVGGMCFAAGTMVHTPDGPRAIEQLEPGDWVMASPPGGGEPKPKRVLRALWTPSKEVVGFAITTSEGVSDVLRVTKEHPFGLAEGGWLPAHALANGDRLVTASGEVATVVAAWSVPGLHDVFNVEVEEFHTYFVGDGGVWAHNVGCSVPVSRHAAWASDLNQINGTVERLGLRALKHSGGDWRKSEELFNKYLGAVEQRLRASGSRYGVEVQPAAVVGKGRVPAFTQEIFSNGNPIPGTIRPFEGSRRLDAAIIDLTQPEIARYGGGTFHKVVSGFDITLNQQKRPIVLYYQEAFGQIPIFDIR